MINRVTSSLCPRYTVRRTLGSLSTNKSMSAARKSPPVLAPSYRSLQIEFTFPIKKNRKWNVINSFELALQYYSQNRNSVLLLYGLPSEFYDNNNIRYTLYVWSFYGKSAINLTNRHTLQKLIWQYLLYIAYLHISEK